ncbi:MAG: hypothetical protein IKQ24_00920, partial [Verrucomicrobia bacterium]|nr:hypothetical protein [Verrucomicrobiota bacterium]
MDPDVRLCIDPWFINIILALWQNICYFTFTFIRCCCRMVEECLSEEISMADISQEQYEKYR